MKTKTALKHYGTKAAIAKALGISRQAVDCWGPVVPVANAVKLAELTKREAQPLLLVPGDYT